MGASARVSKSLTPSGADGSRVDSWDEDADDVVPDLWCVEVDGAIECLSTRQVWKGLAQGRLTPTTPIWRDGLGHWAPIEAVAELTDDEGEERVTVPERSEIRARRRATPVPTSGLRSRAKSDPRVGSRVIATAGRFVGAALALPALVGALASRGAEVGRRSAVWRVLLAFVVLGGGLALGLSWFRGRETEPVRVPRAQRVAVDVGERVRLLCIRGRQNAAEAERRFWGERWR
jgi:hypothetical protein